MTNGGAPLPETSSLVIDSSLDFGHSSLGHQDGRPRGLPAEGGLSFGEFVETR
jgi:hypothetical protein